MRWPGTALSQRVSTNSNLSGFRDRRDSLSLCHSESLPTRTSLDSGMGEISVTLSQRVSTNSNLSRVRDRRDSLSLCRSESLPTRTSLDSGMGEIRCRFVTASLYQLEPLWIPGSARFAVTKRCRATALQGGSSCFAVMARQLDLESDEPGGLQDLEIINKGQQRAELQLQSVPKGISSQDIPTDK